MIPERPSGVRKAEAHTRPGDTPGMARRCAGAGPCQNLSSEALFAHMLDRRSQPLIIVFIDGDEAEGTRRRFQLCGGQKMQLRFYLSCIRCPSYLAEG